MIPSSRLLFWTALLGIPFATLAGLLPAWVPLAVTILLLFGVVVLLDAVRSFGVLDGVEVNSPEVNRLTHMQEGEISLTIAIAERSACCELSYAVSMPPSIRSHQQVDHIRWEPTDERAEIHRTWGCTPRKRGLYHTAQCDLKSPSRWGFWDICRRVASVVEIRVYPDLSKERRHVAGIFLNKGTVGLHTQRQVGQGREFEKLREYIPGDGMDQIHWKATARHNRPMTKVYQIERTQEVYIVLDTSRLSNRPLSSACGTYSEAQIELTIRAALIVGLAAQRNGDRFGLVTFDSQLRTFIKAGSGSAHYTTCREKLYTLTPRANTPDFREIVTSLYHKIAKRSLVLFFTDLSDELLAEEFLQNIEILRRKHVVMVLSPKAGRDHGLFTSDTASSLEDIYTSLAEQMELRADSELVKNLRALHVLYFSLPHETFCLEAVTHYFNVKRRQLV